MFRFVALVLVLAVVGLTLLLTSGGCQRPTPPTTEPGVDDVPTGTEDTAVAFVQKLGGRVARDDKAPGRGVVTVYLSGTKVTDAGLKELAPLKNLTTLDLGATRVTDTGLKELQKALPNCKITR